MTSEWTSCLLGDLVRRGEAIVQTGPFGSQLHSYDYVDSGVPVIPTEAIGRGRILDIPLPQINQIKANELERHRLEVGDILFARRGAQATGLSAIIDRNHAGSLCGTGALLLRMKSSTVHPEYLAIFLSTEETYTWLRVHSVGAVMPNINTEIIKSLPINFPDISEQRSISGFINALDERIAVLRETNATLEAMAQALFKSWFVDFDPVRAKVESGVPHSLETELASLFPDKLEQSELGLVPQGWTVQALDQIAVYLNGLALQKFPPSEGDWLPAIKIAQLRKGDADGADRVGVNLKPEYIVNNGDVLFSWSGSLEVKIWCGGRGALNQHLFKVTSNKFPKWFYYLWTRHHLDRFRQIAASKATTMGHIQRTHLSEAKAFCPPDGLIRQLDRFIAPLLDLSIETRLQSQTLARLRDTLLPRLISGQLRLPDPTLNEQTA